MDALTSASKPADVASWLHAHLPEEEWVNTAADAARESSIDGAALLSMSSDEAASALKVTVFGRKRKLTLLLDKAKSNVTGSSSTGAASSSSAALGSSSSAATSTGSSSASSSADVPSADVLHAAPIDSATCDQALHDEAYALGLCRWAGGALEKLLTKPEHQGWATSEVRASRLRELAALRAQSEELPSVSIVVVGNTGAGKSTLLNAMLGEASILPTNGMRACTACLIEMRYEDSDPVRTPEYRAEIEFLTKEEWDKELSDLLDDLTPNDGPNQGKVSLSVAEDSMAYGSWCKVYAVYGDEFTHSRVRTDRTGPGGRVIYDNPTLESLKEKLRGVRAITHALSTTMHESAKESVAFRRKCERYMDSLKDVHGGSYWPIVKQVRLYSRRWDSLKTGAVLVDAPGVHDDNSARDAVVKRRFKEADAVWIVSNIVRAVNDKTAKDLLGEQFRRQLLMDGQFGSLAFIATQSDVIERAEALRALALPPGTSLRECARARNAYTARRLALDFKAGLREMARDAGEGVAGADRLAAKHSLPVFTVSSVEYQKLRGLRPADGPARVWAELEDTQLPPLIRHVQRQALVRRKALSLRRCEAMRDFALSLLSLLNHEARLPQSVRDAAKAAFDEQAATLSGELEQHTKAAEARIRKAFAEDVAPKLHEGASSAKTAAVETAAKWGISVNEGGLHWATYKATTRRHGVFRINMNEQLVEPIFKAVATQWERSFLTGLSSTLDGLRQSLQGSLGAFHPALLTRLAAARVPDSASSALSGAQTDSLLASLHAKVAEIKTAAQKQQRDLSRSMEPAVQTEMTPGYDDATAEAGTGSHRRRVAKLEAHVERAAPKMFQTATDGVVSKMQALSDGIGQTLRDDVVQAARAAMRTAYSPLWDEMEEGTVQARRALVPHVAAALLETKNAVRRLVEGGGAEGGRGDRGGGGDGSGGGGSGGGDGGGGEGAADGAADGDEDEELVDVTEQRRQAKRAKQQQEAIELDDDDDVVPIDETLAAVENVPPHASAAGTSGSAVKTESRA